MVVRVDTTNLTRGLDFSVIIHAKEEPTVSLYAFNSASHLVEELSYAISQEGVFFKANAKAPYFDGYLLANINSKSMIVKKIGHPRPHFVIGYKPNYTVPYKLFDEAGSELITNNLVNIIDGFYYCEIPENITIMETLKKRFIIKEHFLKLNYDTSMTSVDLPNIDLPNIAMPTTTLPDVILEDVEFPSISLPNVVLPTVEIMEY